MNTEQAAAVLAKCAAFDNRKPSAAVVHAWAEALHPDMSVNDALEFVSEHYAETNQWLMPADLNRAFRKRRRQRLDAVPDAAYPLPPANVSPVNYLTFTRTVRRSIGAGLSPMDAAMLAHDSIGSKELTDGKEED